MGAFSFGEGKLERPLGEAGDVGERGVECVEEDGEDVSCTEGESFVVTGGFVKAGIDTGLGSVAAPPLPDTAVRPIPARGVVVRVLTEVDLRGGR